MTTCGWNFDNSYARLPERLYAVQDPVPVPAPELVLLNHPLAQQLGLDPECLATGNGVAVLAGNRLPEGTHPLAQAYAGHQFGHFTMLGDGRAILLGEQITPSGARFDIQLKGSGQTPFSRRGDGRAALAPMLREYLVSEAMAALGIPTNRSLAVVTTGEQVRRETLLTGAILTRVAASHLRVGTFEYVRAHGDTQLLQVLADYTIARHFPELQQGQNPYLELLRSVSERQAALIARWLLVGFVHGVMNTDNVALSGETIDYGPCAFIDTYHPATVFSSIDHQGRYAYANQPHIAHWNLARFAETLLPLLADTPETAVALAQDAIGPFAATLQRHWLDGMRAKLGLAEAQPEDRALVEDLLALMQRLRADYSNSFRDLALAQLPDTELFRDEAFRLWQTRWHARLRQQSISLHAARALMNRHNPAVIPRNHRVEEALQAASAGEMTPVENLLRVLARPYDELADADRFYRDPPRPSSRPYQTFCGT